MMSRLAALQNLLRFSIPLGELQAELRRYDWDSPKPLVTLNAGDVIQVLIRFVDDELAANEVEEWANAIEMREDIDCQDDLVKEVIFDLANPVLQGPLTVKSARNWIDRLRSTRAGGAGLSL